VGGPNSDETKMRRKRTKEHVQIQTRNKTGRTPSNQTRRQAGGFMETPISAMNRLFQFKRFFTALLPTPARWKLEHGQMHRWTYSKGLGATRRGKKQTFFREIIGMVLYGFWFYNLFYVDFLVLQWFYVWFMVSACHWDRWDG